MAKKIHKLSLAGADEYAFIAIASHENDYRVSWALNQSLGIQLKRENDLGLSEKKTGLEQHFSLFTVYDEQKDIAFRLISNLSENGYLIPEHKNIDFVLQLKGELDDAYVSGLANGIKAIEMVMLAFVIPQESIKPGTINKLKF